VLASGYAWSPHLLLLSGLANGSGLVGRYMTGHAFIGAQLFHAIIRVHGRHRNAQGKNYCR